MAGERPWQLIPADARQRVGWVLLPLRGFLGVTFTFAGAQKLANPGFFDASKPGSIQQQLAAAARLSPIHALVSHLQHAPVTVGVVIALAELAVGIGTLLGIFARIAAIGGVIISLCLFLTVSFHSHPYYTGSDIVFAFAWLPFVIAGSGGALSLDAWVAGVTGSASTETRQQDAPAPSGTTGPFIASGGDHGTTRRSLLSKGVVGLVVFLAGALFAGVDAAVGRLAGGSGSSGTATLRRGRSGGTSGTTGGGGGGSSTGGGASSGPAPKGTPIGAASDVPVGGAAAFNDPASGDTSLVIQPRPGTFVAFDAICPHQGCTVQYFASQKRFVCPCHQSNFDATTGAVLSGPAPNGLRSITLTVGNDGQLYAV
jgi:thiosulfate dehydrogenase (quinone) large subunit